MATEHDHGTSFYTSISQQRVTLMLWPTGHTGTISTTVYLSPKEARRLAAELIEMVDKLPRVAEAADLGIATTGASA